MFWIVESPSESPLNPHVWLLLMDVESIRFLLEERESTGVEHYWAQGKKIFPGTDEGPLATKSHPYTKI